MKTKKELSIIIVSWNTVDITFKCIQTIKKYLPNDKIEIIVVDNGSTDNTTQKLKDFSDLKIIENKQNFGFSKANNIGVKSATSDYLLFLNSDMELIDTSIFKMLKYFQNNPDIGVIGPKFLNTDLTPQASVFPPQTLLNAFKEFWLNKINSYSKHLLNTYKPTKVWSVSGGALMIQKCFLKNIGGWNEKYFFYYEDLDLCRKINQQKKSVIYYPECQLIHHHGASGKNLANTENQWRRLIPSSIKYHGVIKHYLINLIIWTGQKWQKIFLKKNHS